MQPDLQGCKVNSDATYNNYHAAPKGRGMCLIDCMCLIHCTPEGHREPGDEHTTKLLIIFMTRAWHLARGLEVCYKLLLHV